MGDQQCHGGAAIGGQGAAGVEAEPADPEHGGADDRIGQVVGDHLRVGIALALADHDAGDESGYARGDVNDNSAGKVHDAQLAEPAAAPGHVADRQVDHDEPESREEHHREEFHALDKGADHQRRGDDREGHLEGAEEGLGNLCIGVNGIPCAAAKQDLRQAAEKRVPITERHAVAEDHPEHRDQRSHREAVHEHREHVLGSHQAAVEERQGRDRHEEYQRRRDQDPGGVSAVSFRDRDGVGCQQGACQETHQQQGEKRQN